MSRPLSQTSSSSRSVVIRVSARGIIISERRLKRRGRDGQWVDYAGDLDWIKKHCLWECASWLLLCQYSADDNDKRYVTNKIESQVYRYGVDCLAKISWTILWIRCCRSCRGDLWGGSSDKANQWRSRWYCVLNNNSNHPEWNTWGGGRGGVMWLNAKEEAWKLFVAKTFRETKTTFKWSLWLESVVNSNSKVALIALFRRLLFWWLLYRGYWNWLCANYNDQWWLYWWTRILACC